MDSTSKQTRTPKHTHTHNAPQTGLRRWQSASEQGPQVETMLAQCSRLQKESQPGLSQAPKVAAHPPLAKPSTQTKGTEALQ